MHIRIAGLVLLLSLAALVQAESVRNLVTPEKYTQGLLWKIESSQAQPSYLIGTMHVDDPGIRTLFKQAQPYFDKAATVCTEVMMDFATVAAEMQVMFFSDGRTLQSVLADDALYKKTLREADKRGLPEVMVRSMKPFTLAFMLSMPRSEGQMLDEQIYTDAIRANKQVCGLETTDEHSDVFESFDMQTQISLLRLTVERIEEVDAVFPVMLEAYLQRDLVTLAKLVNESFFLEDAKVAETFIQRFLIDRNRKMLQRMKPRIAQGNAFFAVGAMHLTGSAGLLRMLEAEGYNISRLY